MKKHFPGYYPLNQTDIYQHLENIVFVIDTVFLLDIFRLNDKDVNTLFTILNEPPIKDKLWIPYDVAWLYHQCVNNEIINQTGKIQNTLYHLTCCKESIQNNKNYPYLETAIISELEKLTKRIQELFNRQIENLSNALEHDEKKEQINALFTDRIGREYTSAELQEIYTQAKERYSRRVPPGYCTPQSDNERFTYHDMIIWEQIKEHAKEKNKDIILVTGKIQDDWFYIVNDKVISPRQELINEFTQKTNKKKFYCLSSDEFIRKSCAEFHIIHPNLNQLINHLSENARNASTFSVTSQSEYSTN